MAAEAAAKGLRGLDSGNVSACEVRLCGDRTVALSCGLPPVLMSA